MRNMDHRTKTDKNYSLVTATTKYTKKANKIKRNQFRKLQDG